MQEKVRCFYPAGPHRFENLPYYQASFYFRSKRSSVSTSKEELSRMERSGVISRIEEASPWCAGMVAVRGGVRICVDLKPLIESVMRQTHLLLAVERVLSIDWHKGVL